MPDPLALFAAITLAGVAIAYALNSRRAAARALRDRADEIHALHNRLLRLERRADARAHHHGHRDEAVEILPPVVSGRSEGVALFTAHRRHSR